MSERASTPLYRHEFALIFVMTTPDVGGPVMSRVTLLAAGIVLIATIGCSNAALQDRPGIGGATNTGAGTGAGTGMGPMSDWCAALSVIRANCQGCHGSQPLYGAPMPLV